MKKILLINCSKRKKNTYNLLFQTEEILKEHEFDTEIINLHDYKIDYCIGCECCILKGYCVLKDDRNILMEKLKQCDGFIVGSPTYLNNMTGILKSFIDRTCVWFHRSDISGKPAFIIIDTQGSGAKNTLKSIEESLRQWGVFFGGHALRVGSKIYSEPITSKELYNFMNIVCNKKIYTPSFKDVSYFNVQKALAMNVFPLDKNFWMENNLIDACFYPNSKVNPFKSFLGNFLYSLLSKKLKKTETHEIKAVSK